MARKQYADNPHDVLRNPKEWIMNEYSAGRGDMFSLRSYADRRNLMADIDAAHPDDKEGCIVAALRYLLGMEGE